MEDRVLFLGLYLCHFLLKYGSEIVLGGCSNVKDQEKRISFHASTFYVDTRPETRKIRCRWIEFVESTMDKVIVPAIVLPQV